MRPTQNRFPPSLRPILAAFLAATATLLPAPEVLGQASFEGQATPVSQLTVARDFRVELLHTVPKAEQGSWVAMCVDPRGRLIVSDQYGKLYRLTVPPLGTSSGLAIEPIDIAIGQAQGLLHAFDSLYAMVANEAYQGRGLYRIRDTNGDDRYDEVRLIRKLDGGGEHGPHAILPSPDGRSLTIIVGNQTRLTEFSASRVPKHWSEDHLLPRLWDGNGFMKGVLGPGGWIARTDPDGRSWELLATGFRNEYDAAYNLDGDLFTYDADMEWDMNTPWYRPTRINFVASGAEFGWRSGAGKWPDYYPDSLGSVANIGPGSPTGVTFGYGARFPARYQQALFICDWSYGKLKAVHLTPDGAGYHGDVEEFISGSPLPLTDLVVNPTDGALYVAIGGRKTQSALYRVTYTGPLSTRPVRADSRGARARQVRRSLEAFHGRQDPAAIRAAWPHLGSPDRHLRFAARIAVEHQPVDTWRDRALAERDPQASITALLALVRSSARDSFHRKPTDPTPDPGLKDRVIASLERLEWKRLSDPLRLDLLRAYGLTFIRLGPPDDTTRRRLLSWMEPLFPAGSRTLNAELAPMLVHLEAPSAAAKLTTALAKAPSQEEQLDYARALRVLKTGWTTAQRRVYFEWFLKAANFRGGASLAGFLRDIKADAVRSLPDADRAALKEIIDAQPPKLKPLENLLAGRSQVREWTLESLAPTLSKGLRSGRNFERGRELFGAVGCFSCHRFASEGGAIGPDLTGIAGRFSPRDLLESIVDPNKEISDQYQSVVVTRKDGDTVTGRVANLSEEILMLTTDMFDPNGFANIKRSDIVSIQPSPVSPMPEGLLNTLREDEIHDLLAFVLSRGDRTHRMFR